MFGRRPGGRGHLYHGLAWLAVLSATLIGAALRIAYAFKGGLWRDEAQALGIAAMPSVGEITSFLARHESHPPAYYLLLRGWISAFGGSDASGLALSLLFGIVLIPGVFFVTRSMHSPRAGVLAALLASVHPGLIQYSASVRPYSLLSLLAVTLMFVLWRILRQPSGRLHAGYTALSLVMVYTHHWAWLVVGVAGLLWLWFGTRARGVQELRAIAVVHGFVAVAYSPWIPSLLYQVRVAGHPRMDVSVWKVLPLSVFATTWLPSLAATILVALSIWVYLSRSRDLPDADRGLALGISAGIPVLCAGMTAVLVPFANLTTLWCYSIVAPAMLVAIALMLGQREVGPLGFRSVGIQTAWVSAMAVTWAGLQSAPRANTKAIAQYVRAGIAAGDQLIVMPGYIIPSFYRYFGGGTRAYSLPEDSLIAYIPYDNRIARDLDPRAWVRLMTVIDSTRIRCTRLWVVVEAGTPPHLRRLVGILLDEAEARLGPPDLVESSLPGLGVVEHASVRRYAPCRG